MSSIKIMGFMLMVMNVILMPANLVLEDNFASYIEVAQCIVLGVTILVTLAVMGLTPVFIKAFKEQTAKESCSKSIEKSDISFKIIMADIMIGQVFAIIGIGITVYSLM